jgi:plasmid replication initiation protein
MDQARREPHELSYNPSHYTVMANDIIKGKQSMTLQEARLLRLVITQIAQSDNDLQTYSCRIQDLARFLNVPANNLYRDIREVCRGLMRLNVEIGTGNPKSPWKIWHWMSTAEYDGNGTITLRLSDEIKQFVLDLSGWFTRYQLSNILSMRSFYSIRLYEILKCEDNKTNCEQDYHEFTIQQFRAMLGCEKKYKQIGELKKYVIEPAAHEISEKTDILVEVEYIKTGRPITGVRFYIHDKPKRQQLPGQTELNL